MSREASYKTAEEARNPSCGTAESHWEWLQWRVKPSPSQLSKPAKWDTSSLSKDKVLVSCDLHRHCTFLAFITWLLTICNRGVLQLQLICIIHASVPDEYALSIESCLLNHCVERNRLDMAICAHILQQINTHRFWGVFAFKEVPSCLGL